MKVAVVAKNLFALVKRERAVIAGFLASVLTVISTGELTKATAIPVLSGLVLRFFVTPYHKDSSDDE